MVAPYAFFGMDGTKIPFKTSFMSGFINDKLIKKQMVIIPKKKAKIVSSIF
jgi:hypothetical protein